MSTCRHCGHVMMYEKYETTGGSVIVYKCENPACRNVDMPGASTFPPPPFISHNDLNSLDWVAMCHIIGNAVMVAQAHPDSPAARTLLNEVRLHLGQTHEAKT